MLCNVCNNKESTVFLTQIIEGKMQKMNLCERCAKEKGIDDPSGFPLAELLLGLGLEGPQGVSVGVQKTSQVEITCPHCHFSQTNFKKTGRLGCSYCYTIFSEGLIPMLRTMHPDMVHCGKVPKKLSLQREEKFKLESLQGVLKKAIAEEQYETAAKIRDEIYALDFIRNSTSVTDCGVASVLEPSSASCTLKFCPPKTPGTPST